MSTFLRTCSSLIALALFAGCAGSGPTDSRQNPVGDDGDDAPWTCEDGWEDNDEIATAVDLPSSRFTAGASAQDPDVWRVVLQPGELRVFGLDLNPDEGDIDLVAIDAESVVINASEGTGSYEEVEVENEGSVPMEVFLVVVRLDAEGCSQYTLYDAGDDGPGPVDPPDTCAPDALEDNDTFLDAGSTTTLRASSNTVSAADPDIFRVQVPTGMFMAAEVTNVSGGAVSVRLHRDYWDAPGVPVFSYEDPSYVDGSAPTEPVTYWVEIVTTMPCVQYSLEIDTLAM